MTDDTTIIEAAYNDMLNSSLTPFSDEERGQIFRAFQFANEAHKGVRRKSGEPYITHPIAVAKVVVAEIGLGYKSVVTALLHDVVEDTNYTVEDIQSLFGEQIAYLVGGLTKLDTIFDKHLSLQAENFKKMLLAMSNDIRVVLIKLADRLHNMRTLGAMSPQKQEKIASETTYLYAPLAHRFGLYNIKTELEDLTLKYKLPQAYDEIRAKISDSEEQRRAYIEQFKAPITQKLTEQNISFELTGRVKSVYSIWEKMQKKQIPFEEVFDLFAVRVVFTSAEGVGERSQCWQIYSIVTDIYKPNNDRLRDWVSTPKANGYEALHITVMGPQGRWVELQIRSKRMNETAERGYAAHWRYKDREDNITEVLKQDRVLDSFLANIRETLSSGEVNTTEFLDQLKLNLFSSEITAFTPKGKMVSLPQDATALDFAYAIHSGLGIKAIGAKINHKLTPLSQVLHNGDQVEILTADNQKPKQEWLNFATTARALSQIKTALKKEERERLLKGKADIERAVRSAGWFPNAILYKRLLSAYGVGSKDELFSRAGAGLVDVNAIEKIVKKRLGRSKFFRYWELQLLPHARKRSPDAHSKKAGTPAEPQQPQRASKKVFWLAESSSKDKLNYRIAPCCKPIPGDDVIGFEEAQHTVVIHKKLCPNAIKEASQHGDNIVNAKWAEHKTEVFPVAIRMVNIDRPRLLMDIVKIISVDFGANIKRINSTDRDGVVTTEIELEVHDAHQLHSIMKDLSKTEGNKSIARMDVGK